MARPLRIEYPGAVYHVTMRGNNRRNLFKWDKDRERFLKSLSDSLARFDVRLYLFCLMTNHIHLVLETPRGNLSRFMHRLQTAYTVYFNRRHNESGHLMQGRYGASVVDEDGYILKLSRYVHLNPVFVKAHKSKTIQERTAILRNYFWSSYRSYIGLCKRLDYIDYSPILDMIQRSKKKQSSAYRRFVESGISDIDKAFIADKTRSRLCIGSEECNTRIKDLYRERIEEYGCREDVSFRREAEAIPAMDVLTTISQAMDIPITDLKSRSYKSCVRPLAAKLLCQYGGLNQREVAPLLGISSGAGVCQQIRRLDQKLQKDRHVQMMLQRIISELELIMA